MTRGSSLSDPKVIERINRDFVPLEFNVTRGFPEQFPGLKLWEKAYERKFKSLLGFTTTVILSPDGQRPLGTAGMGYKWQFDSSASYRPDKYLLFLDQSLARFQSARAIENDPRLGAEEKQKKLALHRADTERAIDESAKEAKLFVDE